MDSPVVDSADIRSLIDFGNVVKPSEEAAPTQQPCSAPSPIKTGGISSCIAIFNSVLARHLCPCLMIDDTCTAPLGISLVPYTQIGLYCSFPALTIVAPISLIDGIPHTLLNRWMIRRKNI
jgi:hypothetical protein